MAEVVRSFAARGMPIHDDEASSCVKLCLRRLRPCCTFRSVAPHAREDCHAGVSAENVANAIQRDIDAWPDTVHGRASVEANRPVPADGCVHAAGRDEYIGPW